MSRVFNHSSDSHDKKNSRVKKNFRPIFYTSYSHESTYHMLPFLERKKTLNVIGSQEIMLIIPAKSCGYQKPE